MEEGWAKGRQQLKFEGGGGGKRQVFGMGCACALMQGWQGGTDWGPIGRGPINQRKIASVEKCQQARPACDVPA